MKAITLGLIFCVIARPAIGQTQFIQSETRSFIENKGQIHDQNNKARKDILFSGSDSRLSYHYKFDGFEFMQCSENTESPVDIRDKKPAEKQTNQITLCRIEYRWLHCNKTHSIETTDELLAKHNFYMASCPQGALGVRSFKEITYKNLYDGIDVNWYHKDGQLKYDYLVEAGADYKKIQIQIDGYSSIAINKLGQLVVKTPLETIVEDAPLVYQENRTLSSRWILKENIISFEIHGVNMLKPLIIDPLVRLWGTYYGHAGDEYGRSCATDNSGNVFLAGDCSSTVAIATTGAHQTTFGGSFYDAFIAKFNSAGVRQWSTYYGGSWRDRGYSCATDASGSVYLSGETEDSTRALFTTPGAHQVAFGGWPYDAFLVKFNSSGVRQWSTYYGDQGEEWGLGCTTDPSGNVYMCGYTAISSTLNIATPGAHQTIGNGSDGFLVKFNGSGVRQWGTYYGGSGFEYAKACAIDPAGNVLISGMTTTGSGTAIATIGAHQSSSGGGITWGDGFIAKFNSSGVRQWGSFYGGNGDDWGLACCADPSGNIYMTGLTQSSVGIATSGAQQATFGLSYDSYLVKLNSSGVRQWATYCGAQGFEQGNGCITDASGNVYMTGEASSGTTTIIATPGSLQSIAPSGAAMLQKYNPSGVREWGTYCGASSDIALGITKDPIGNIYICGRSFNFSTFIPSSGAHQTTSGGGAEAFLVKFRDCATQTITIGAQNPLCSNSTLTLTSTITGTATSTFIWSGPASFTSSLQNPTITNVLTNQSGNYSVTIGDGLGCTQTSVITITVNSTPTISVNSGSICSGNNFTINPVGASIYSVQGSNMVVSPLTNSTYTLQGVSSQGCLSNIVTSTVFIHSLPSITANSGSVCSGQPYVIIPAGANSYSITGNSFTVTPASTATYAVVGTNTNGCVSQNAAIVTVSIIQLPTISVNSGTVCKGDIFTIVPNGANTYSISGGSFTVSPGSTFTYTVTGANLFGCSASSPVTVTVNQLPVLTSNSGTICSGQTFVIVPAGASTYSITGGSFTVAPTITSSYSITGTNAQGCVSLLPSISEVTVLPLPQLQITSTSPTLCAGESSTLQVLGVDSYTWGNGNSNSSLFINPTTTTLYLVSGTAANGCVNTNSFTQYVSACDNITQLVVHTSLGKVYPIPSTGEVIIETNRTTKLTIYNSLGQLIIDRTIEAQVRLDLSHFARGNYLLVLKEKSHIQHVKLVLIE